MFKKALCLAIAVLMIASMAVIPAFAAETDEAAAGATYVTEGVIKFKLSGVLANSKSTAFHIFTISSTEGGSTGGAAFGWGGFKEAYHTNNGDGTVSYDIAQMIKSSPSAFYKKGLLVGQKYAIIVYDLTTKVQSFDLTFDTDCLGDTIYLTDIDAENPVDSTKTTKVARWTNNYPRCHAVIQFGSTDDGSDGTLLDPEGLSKNQYYGIDNWNEFTPANYKKPQKPVVTTPIVTNPETGEKVSGGEVVDSDSGNGTNDTGAEQGIIFVSLALVITGVCVVMFTRKKSKK
ncbi:MAG: hypothetical protein LBM65_01945 [Oscillospiraceae bacterium]|jgi:hypothetical protein|nr:hypothetical protein [Oscillospiraceae bacterium]